MRGSIAAVRNFNYHHFKEIVSVLRTGVLSSRFGKYTQKFEKVFAKKLDKKYAIAMNSGTSALHASLLALGVKENDEVIIPGMSVICVGQAVLQAKAKPVFADIDENNWNINPEKIQLLITKKTKAIIAVSLFGVTADMDSICKIAKKHRIKIIDDAAQSIGATYKNRLSGTMGDVGIYSFEQVKHISCGEGGMAVTNDKSAAEKINSVAKLGINKKAKLRVSYESIGWNYRITELQSAIAMVQLKKLNSIIAERRKTASLYDRILKGYNWIVPQDIPSECNSSYFCYPICINKKPLEVFRAKGVELKQWFMPIFNEPVLRKYYIKGSCPVAEKLDGTIFTLRTDYYDKPSLEKQLSSLKRAIRMLENK